MSRSDIYLRVSQQLFPAPLSLGPRMVGWAEEEIAALTRGSSLQAARERHLRLRSRVPEIGSVVCRPDVYSYHGWQEVNAWATLALQRSEHARKAAIARWSGKFTSNTPSSDEKSPTDAESNAPLQSLHRLLPAPDPPLSFSVARESKRGSRISARQALYRQSEIEKWKREYFELYVGSGDQAFVDAFQRKFGMTPEQWEGLFTEAMAEVSQ